MSLEMETAKGAESRTQTFILVFKNGSYVCPII